MRLALSLPKTQPHAASLRTVAIRRGFLLGLVAFVYVYAKSIVPTVLLLTTVHLVSLVVIGGWWVWHVIRREALARTPITLPMIGMLGATTIATIFSIDPRASFDGLVFQAVLTLGFVIVCDLLLAGWEPERFEVALLTLVTCLIGQSLLAIVQSYAVRWIGRVPEYPPFLVPFRLFGVYEWPTQLAGIVNLALPFASLRLARARRPGTRALWAIWLVAAAIVLFFTRSRGGWLAAGTATGVVLIGLTADSGRLRASWRVWAAAGGYGALFGALLLIDARLSTSEFTTNGGDIAAGASRFTFWSVAWDMLRRDWLTGSGPLTYEQVYSATLTTVRFWIAPHPHNAVLDVLSQQGILGGVAFGAILLLGGWAIIRAWLKLCTIEPRRRFLLIGVSAALGSFLVHSCFDLLWWSEISALMIIVLCGLGLDAAGSIVPGPRLHRAMILALGVGVLLGASVLQHDRALAAARQAMVALRSHETNRATSSIERAIDLDPTLIKLYMQAGAIDGSVALETGDRGLLEQAIERYEAAVTYGPQSVSALLNLAWLQDQAGRTQAVERTLRTAVARGADWALPALLLGDRLARHGQTAEAEQLFMQAFRSESHAHQMAACRNSPACRSAAEGASESPLEHMLDEASAQLRADQPRDALETLQAIPLTGAEPRAWVLRAQAHLALGEIQQARYAISTAESMYVAASPVGAAPAALTRASIELAVGNLPSAAAALQHSAPSENVLPPIEIMQQTPDHLSAYRLLGRIERRLGNAEAAAHADQQADALQALLDQ